MAKATCSLRSYPDTALAFDGRLECRKRAGEIALGVSARREYSIGVIVAICRVAARYSGQKLAETRQVKIANRAFQLMRTPIYLILSACAQCRGKGQAVRCQTLEHEMQQVTRSLRAEVVKNIANGRGGDRRRKKPIERKRKGFGRKGLGDHLIHSRRTTGRDILGLDMRRHPDDWQHACRRLQLPDKTGGFNT